MDRRAFLVGAAGAGVAGAGSAAFANVPTPYDWDAEPPRQSRQAFVAWMVKNRGEEERFLGSAGTGCSRSSPIATSGTRPTSAPF
jgi:hypothetical protein